MSNIENCVLEKLNYDIQGNLTPFETSVTAQIGEFGTIILNLKPSNPSEIKVFPNAKNGLYNANVQEYRYVEGNPLVGQFTYDGNASALVFNRAEVGNHIMANINAIGCTYLSSSSIATKYDNTSGVIETLDETINLLNNADLIKDGTQKIMFTPQERESLKYKTDKGYVDGLVNSLSSGSPKGVYPTIEDIKRVFPNGDNSIYLTSNNGNWNYWNGSTWNSGGVYQSVIPQSNSIAESHLVDGSVTQSKMKAVFLDGVFVNNTVSINTINKTIDITSGGFLMCNTHVMGIPETHLSWVGEDYRVKFVYWDEKNSTFIIDVLKHTTSSNDGNLVHCFSIYKDKVYDINNAENIIVNGVPNGGFGVIKAENIEDSSITHDKLKVIYKKAEPLSGTISINTNMKTITFTDAILCYEDNYKLISTTVSMPYTADYRVQYVYLNISNGNILIDELRHTSSVDDKNLALIFVLYKKVVYHTSNLKCFIVDGVVNGGYGTDKINIPDIYKQGTLFSSDIIKVDKSNKKIILGSNSKGVIVENKHYAITNTEISLTSWTGFLTFKLSNKTFSHYPTVSSFNTSTNDEVLIGVLTTNGIILYSSTYTYINQDIILNSKWRDKKYGALGDSQTEGLGATYPYGNVVSDINGCKFTNYGDSGETVAKDYPLSFVNRIDSMASDLDIISVMGGTNDFWQNVPLGNMEDRTLTTFYGAYHLMLEKLIKKYPDKIIFTMTPPSTHRPSGSPQANNRSPYPYPTNGNGNTLEEFDNAMKEVSVYYSIPCFDLRKNQNMSMFMQEHVTMYANDGVHYNNLGHLVQGKKIARFMEQL